MIRVYEVLPGTTAKSGNTYKNITIITDTRFGSGANFNLALDSLVCVNNKMCSEIKEILLDSYAQIYKGENEVQLMLDWARTQFPELFI